MKIGDKVRVTVETNGGPSVGMEGEIVRAEVNGPEVYLVRFAGWTDGWPQAGPSADEGDADDCWALAETQMELIEQNV